MSFTEALITGLGILIIIDFIITYPPGESNMSILALIMPFIVGIASLLMACSPTLPDEKEKDILADARKKRKARMKKIDEMYGIEPGQKDY